jgi:hypothetical protein
MLSGDPETQGQFAAALASSGVFVPGRERSKRNIIGVIGEARMAMWELGRRGVERGDLSHPSDVCLLFVDEVEAYVDGSHADVRWLANAGELTQIDIIGTNATTLEQRWADGVATQLGIAVHGFPSNSSPVATR